MAVGFGAVLAVVGGCSDDSSTGPLALPTSSAVDRPAVTTIDLTLDGTAVDLGDATLKCYDHEGHLMVEAFNADDPDASHFLMDYYRDEVSLSIGVEGGESGVFRFEPGAEGQTAEVTRDGDEVTVSGTISGSSAESAPRPFTIDARCAEFFDTPPDSSKLDTAPSIPATCPGGEVLCFLEGNRAGR